MSVRSVALSILARVVKMVSPGEENLLNKEAQDENRPVLKLHANHRHGGADVRLMMKVTGAHNDNRHHIQVGECYQASPCARRLPDPET